MSRAKALFTLLAIAAAALLAGAPAAAQDFPSRPVRIVVASVPGSAPDVLARVLAEALAPALKQPVVVDNKPGAGGVIGVDSVAKAPADGHTILLAAPDLVVTPAVRQNMPYDIEKLTYLTRVWVQTAMIVAGPKSGVNTIQELIAKIKANPGAVKHATNGVGSLTHFGALKFDAAIGGKTIAVPYGGQGPGSVDTVAGVVDFQHGAAVPFLNGLKPLAPSGSSRHPLYPNLPTLAELGIKDADWVSWFGFLAPPNLPKPIADRLTRELVATMKEPEVIEKLRKATGITQTEEPLVGDAFRKVALDEYLRWKEIATREKIVVQ